ncbi:hypothetical protein CKL83_27740 [Bacillus anthracis]|uniref:Uncharacterized protein n=1 Tax=Bacillus anthracis TaxID=1392 RepID=Q6EZH8_BACAN|nr:hypothetical protein BX_A0212 [Bacillus anthracis str. A2012]AAT35501.1 conserved hypothetical protein [Bacillus anthracis str. 'Ames Ancestor']ACP17773.1 conserved hypothetical protein [Bacillus anthracis str. CDC 684]ACQ50974.1 conserved hypothetical protein [Bacillus anthracis str. A0248]ADK08233.1 hypothetical protein BACI_pCIXO101980 [Bacillus cereus biovar anthracis str. CI]AIF59730.1 hypothetical protein HYU01_28985 [Bacillus anthracis]AIK60832.1 hypothetical protein DJ46_5622 [Baci
MCTSNIASANVSFEKLKSQEENEKSMASICPNCKKHSFKELYNDYPKWIQFCLCCNYREVNTLESPFVY